LDNSSDIQPFLEKKPDSGKIVGKNGIFCAKNMLV
jgi:hypothetical protein